MSQRELYKKERKKIQSFTIEPSLWEAFRNTCQTQEMNASQIIRIMIRDYIEKKKQIELIPKK